MPGILFQEVSVDLRLRIYEQSWANLESGLQTQEDVIALGIRLLVEIVNSATCQ